MGLVLGENLEQFRELLGKNTSDWVYADERTAVLRQKPGCAAGDSPKEGEYWVTRITFQQHCSLDNLELRKPIDIQPVWTIRKAISSWLYQIINERSRKTFLNSTNVPSEFQQFVSLMKWVHFISCTFKAMCKESPWLILSGSENVPSGRWTDCLGQGVSQGCGEVDTRPHKAGRKKTKRRIS